MSIIREQPPEEVSSDLAAYLNRRFDSIADALDQPVGYPVRKEMPYKPQVGAVHYFGDPTLHNYDATITSEGFWGLTSDRGWIKLGGSVDYNLDVLRGLVPGHAMVSIAGHDPTVPNGGPNGLSPQFGTNGYAFDQSAISATPAVVGVASTDNTNDNVAGTGALTARVTGLDSAGIAATEDVVMTGQTAVNTIATFSAIFSVTVLTTGSNTKNVGTIYVGTGTFTLGVPAVRMVSMQIGSNVSISGYYVVPAGKTLYARNFLVTIGTTNKDVEVFIEVSFDGIQWYTRLPFGSGGGDVTSLILAQSGFPAGTHIRMNVSGSAISTDVTAFFVGELVDD